MLKIDLSGKIAVITGATGQLGRVMCRTLAECGADIAIHYHRNKTKAEELKTSLEELGVRAVIVTGDVSSTDDVFAMAAQIQETLGHPDIIINNAVVQYSPWTSVLEQPVSDYDSQYKSCVLHNVNMAKAFTPAMIEKGCGRIIGINTECAMQCHPGQSAYAAAKRGMDGIFRVLAREVGPHQITVNQVAPGWTISEQDRINGTEKQESDRNIPLRRRGTDQEIANVVSFLASDLASYVTGTYIPVCGGDVMPGI